MKAKAMKRYAIGCMHDDSHPKGKALADLALGVVLFAFAGSIIDQSMTMAMIGVIFLLRGALRFWETRCHC